MEYVLAYVLAGIILLEVVRTWSKVELVAGGVIGLVFFWPIIILLAFLLRSKERRNA